MVKHYVIEIGISYLFSILEILYFQPSKIKVDQVLPGALSPTLRLRLLESRRNPCLVNLQGLLRDWRVPKHFKNKLRVQSLARNFTSIPIAASYVGGASRTWRIFAKFWKFRLVLEHELEFWTWNNRLVHPRAMTNKTPHPREPTIAAVRTFLLSSTKIVRLRTCHVIPITQCPLRNTIMTILTWAVSFVFSIRTISFKITTKAFRNTHVRNLTKKSPWFACRTLTFFPSITKRTLFMIRTITILKRY